MFLGFKLCRKDLGVGLVVVLVVVPIFVTNGSGKGGGMYGEPLGVCVMNLGSEPGDEVGPAIILWHEVEYGQCEFSIAHVVSFQVAEGVIQVLHVV